MNNYDLSVFQAINNLASHNILINYLGIFFADYLAFALMAILFILWFRPQIEKTKNEMMIFTALASAFISRYTIKTAITIIYARPRPYMVLASAHKLISMPLVEDLQSFPSGHALFFFSLSMSIYFFDKKLGCLFFAASIIMGIARIFVGVHWPSDVLCGAIIGIVVAFIVHVIYEKYGKRSVLDK